MRLFTSLSMLLLLTSCSTYRTQKPIPQKVFQYSYKNPGRIVTSPDFARHLTNSPDGTTIRIQLPNKQLAAAKLGRKYFSASGYHCRRYKVQNNYQYAACYIVGKWHEASPIILKN